MLHIFGDSHTQILGGGLVTNLQSDENRSNRYKNIKIHWIKGALAYNLIDSDLNLLKWGKHVIDCLILETDVTAILLVFGEIDIRVHVIKNALKKNENPFQNNKAIANKLCDFAIILAKYFKIPIFILSPIPSAPNFAGYNPNSPNTGSDRERNYLTYQFGRILAHRIKSINEEQVKIYVVNLFEELVHATLKTNSRYYAPDNVHLNYAGLDIFVKAFNKIIKSNNLQIIDYYNINQLKYTNKFIEKDIASNCKLYKISSSEKGSDSLDKLIAGCDVIFHTKCELNPYVFIDIGYISPLSKIILGNRKNFEERCKNLTISISDMPKESSFIEIWASPEIFGIDGSALEISVEQYIGKIRFIKLELKSVNYFHLSSLKLIENSFLDY
jgi:hypothetical protein